MPAKTISIEKNSFHEFVKKSMMKTSFTNPICFLEG